VPPRNWQLRLNDILTSIEKIKTYAKGMDEKTFLSDEKTMDAVIHNLTVLGEAVAHIPEEVQQKYPSLPWPQMKGIRNVLVHEYYKLNPPTLWKTITHDLPPVENALREILKK
jgi:uncharacterized protein with HEPN domain